MYSSCVCIGSLCSCVLSGTLLPHQCNLMHPWGDSTKPEVVVLLLIGLSHATSINLEQEARIHAHAACLVALPERSCVPLLCHQDTLTVWKSYVCAGWVVGWFMLQGSQELLQVHLQDTGQCLAAALPAWQKHAVHFWGLPRNCSYGGKRHSCFCAHAVCFNSSSMAIRVLPTALRTATRHTHPNGWQLCFASHYA